MLIFRQLLDTQSSTYTYLLGDSVSREAVIIDPVFEQMRRDVALINELDLRLLWSLDTHVHADHITGAWLLKQELGNWIGLSASSGARGADRYLADGGRITFGQRWLEARATPGHTRGCITFVLDDTSMAFTGDSLLIRGSGRADFQEGDPRLLYSSIRTQIFTLPAECLLYPAHDYRGLTVTSVEEERRCNPRLGGDISEDDFVAYMQNMSLPHPKKMDIAVPANLKCGIPDGDPLRLSEPSWAPLTCTSTGVWEIDARMLNELLETVQLLDVREPDEFEGPLGHIRGAKLIPLGELSRRAGEVLNDRPVVAVCRAGARSAQAVLILQQAGINKVAKLAGGMLRWDAERLPVNPVILPEPCPAGKATPAVSV